MDRDKLPIPTFTREEMIYIQELLNVERRRWFNHKMDMIDLGHDASESDKKYQLAKSLRNKVYHLGGRDTLARQGLLRAALVGSAASLLIAC